MQLYSYPVTWLYSGTTALHKTYICHKTACDYSTQVPLMHFSLWQICRDTFKTRAGMHVVRRQLGSLKLSHTNKNWSTDFCKIFLYQISWKCIQWWNFWGRTDGLSDFNRSSAWFLKSRKHRLNENWRWKRRQFKTHPWQTKACQVRPN